MVVPIVQYGCICMTGLKYYTENKQCMKKHSKKNKYMFSRLCSHSWSKIIYVFRNITIYCRWGKGRVVKLNNAWSYLFWWTRCTVSTLVEKCKYSPCPHETLVFTPSLPCPSNFLSVPAPRAYLPIWQPIAACAPPRTWNVSNATEQLNFLLYFILKVNASNYLIVFNFN